MPVLALLVLLGLAAPDTVLPETPEDWRYERLEFPLAFAPDLELSGYEELRFAPGMFDASSDSYFSYVLGLHLDGALDVDTEFVTAFLESYYRGLCEASTEDPADLDLSGFGVSVARADRGFTATVDMIDTFVTGQPLRLHLELAVRQAPGATQVLGLVSPAPTDAAVWTELRAIGARWQAQRPAPTFLNHLFLIPDEATYRAIADSEFLKTTFAVFEERTTTRADTSYTGLYFYGDRTYFEFLRPDPERGWEPGSTGLAFGFESEGRTGEVAAALDAIDVRTFAGPITRGLDGDQVPWFEILGIEQPTTTSRLQLFSLEYDSSFLESWHGDLPPEGGGITRAAILQRYAASLGRLATRDSTLFADVTTVHLALDAPVRDRLLAVCGALGWNVTGTDGTWVAVGPDLRCVMTTSDEPGGITGFDVALRRPVDDETLRLGALVVELRGRTAAFRLPSD